jgi:hypothetical protein
MWYVAPSFKDKEWLCEPYEKEGKMYVKVMGAKTPREIRVYDEWQNSWPAALKPKVERKNDCFLAFNYPDGRYGYVVGMREVDGRQGFWRYTKLPTKPYGWYKNLVLSPLFGYIGTLDKPPIKELEPIFVDISEVQIENGFKRLINDEWYQSELKRLEELMI